MASSRTFFDQRYYTAGGLYDINSFPNAVPFLTDPWTFGPRKPFAIYGGLRLTL
jgi:hypothetical protein